MSLLRTRPRWWGGPGHTVFTVAVFVVLASLDNAAIGIVPPLYGVISRDLGVSEAAIGLVTALTILITAFTAVFWGYLGDKGDRKRLLLYGTLIWAGGTFLTGVSRSSFPLFLMFQVATAIGLGCILSVGFSVISDFVPPRRRGLAMSFWGLSQGIGTFSGFVFGGILGASNWPLPFFVVAGGGLGLAVLYLFTFDPSRGRAEPELSDIFEAGGEYESRIQRSDIPALIQRRSNIWLVLQGFTAQFAYGSLIWLPRLFQAKVEALDFSLETATVVGSIFAGIVYAGALFSIGAGQIGDVWARRDPRARAMLSSIGILGAVPLFMVLFFLPLRGLDIPEVGAEGNIEVILAVLKSVISNPWVAGSLILALGAFALTSADSPNWFAMISDVNPPEHRGTVFGLANLSNGVGRALGIWLTAVAFGYLSTTGRLPAPLNFAAGLAIFQLFFLPTAWCYYQASKTVPGDAADVKASLAKRAAETG